jgi:uncharacterized cupredoxin-like copper-binding protein
MMRNPLATRRILLGRLALVSVLGFAVASCGADAASNAGPTTTVAEVDAHAEGDHEDEGHTDGYEFGDPMEAADAARVIEIAAKDDFTFEPASITVAAGETVTFRVENVGVIPHDFTLGDSHLQEEHEAEMAKMSTDDMAMHDEPNAFSLAPGETKEMTWHLTEGGEILFGCHTPGHYAAGMIGTITTEL